VGSKKEVAEIKLQPPKNYPLSRILNGAWTEGQIEKEKYPPRTEKRRAFG